MNANFDEVESLRARFLAMDADHNGVLDELELRRAINDLRADGLWNHPTTYDEILGALDTDASGSPSSKPSSRRWYDFWCSRA